MTRGRTVLLVLAGAALVIAAGMLVWISGQAQDVAGATASTAKGSQVAPGLVPLALAAGAGGFAFTLVDRWARRGVALIVIALGVALAAGTAGIVLTPPTGLTDQGAAVRLDAVHLSPTGPALAAVGALLVALGGMVALVSGGRWPRRAARQATGPRPAAEISEWERLSRGEDPT